MIGPVEGILKGLGGIDRSGTDIHDLTLRKEIDDENGVAMDRTRIAQSKAFMVSCPPHPGIITTAGNGPAPSGLNIIFMSGNAGRGWSGNFRLGNAVFRENGSTVHRLLPSRQMPSSSPPL